MKSRPEGLGGRSLHVRDQIMAALAERGRPMTTKDVETAVHAQGVHYGQAVYQMLVRLHRRREIVRMPNPDGGARAPAIWLYEPDPDEERAMVANTWDVLRAALEADL